MFRKLVLSNTFKRVAVKQTFQPKQFQFAGFSTNGTNGTNATNGDAVAPKEGTAAEGTAAPAEPEPVDPIKVKEYEIVGLKKEIKDLKDVVLRSRAEEENVRRIAKKDVESARTYANSSFAKAMLDVADNLERALNAVPADKKNTSDPTLKSLIEGIEMTDKNLQKIFAQFGVAKYGAVNDVFDPNIHDALYQLPVTEGTEPNTIGSVMKTGYKLKDRVIRAAQVGTRVASS